jgi:hypothetical protein
MRAWTHRGMRQDQHNVPTRRTNSRSGRTGVFLLALDAVEQCPKDEVTSTTSLLSPMTAKPRRPTSPVGFTTPGPMKVIVKRPRRHKLPSNPEIEHDFSKDQECCAKCGMRRSVWEATHVPCPGEPYAVDANRPLSRC